MTSLTALVDEWVDYLRVEKGASAHTVSNYRRDAVRYAFDMESRGKSNVDDVTTRDIEDYTMRLASGAVTGRLLRLRLSRVPPLPSADFTSTR